MNTRDFVVVPWGKPGNSVKLKYKHAHELQMEKIQLELETQEMQKKLQEFQSTWNKGKEEIKSSGYHWKSGNMGKLGNQSRIMSQNKGNAIKLSSGRVKLKLLKEQIQEPVKQPLNYKMASSFGSEGSRMRRKVCGQCENKAALLVCLECGEDYCSGCFAKMHQKGALKFHRTTLLQAKSQILSSVLDVAHQFIKEANPSQGGNTSTEESKKSQHKQKAELLPGSNSDVTTATEGVDCTDTGVRTLYERSLDEETPAQPFREAMSQWRAGHLEENGKQNLHEAKPVFIFIDSVEECEVQTNLKIWTEPINIEFTEDSLTYMEKLWLKKHRRTPEDQLRSLLTGAFAHSRDTTSVTQCSQDETADDDSDVEEAKLKYPPLFMPVEKLNIKRPQPSLTIVELDDTYEEEFGDPGTIVPYRVEIADGESQLSFTFPDYQKNYISCENDFYQHLVFNKGNTDLLNLCLKNSSTYCRDDLKGTSNTDFDNTVDSDISSYEFKKIEESSSFERNVKEKNIDPGNDQKSDDSCMPLGSKDSLSSTDSATPFIQNIFQNTTEFMNCSNPPESPNVIASKTTKSPLLLREIALRKKPVNERYKGTERSFTVDKSERLRFLPSANIACSHSCSTIAFADDRVWVPDSSLIEHPGDAGTLCDFQSDETSPPSAQPQKTGQKSQRPSTANYPLFKSTQKVSSCLSSPCSRSRSAAAQSQSRAASEISEIEYIDITDQNEPFLDNAADQQTLDSLEKELKVLRNLEDPSEKLHNLTSEELPAFNPHLMNLSEMPTDFLDSACVKGPYEAEEISTSGKDAKVQSLLLLGDYSTDEEEEDFLDKQHVLTLP